MQDFTNTILTQYSNSPVIYALIDSFNACIDPSANIDAFYSYIWNVQTAIGYGLDVWGRIVGVQRVLHVASGTYLGFAEAGDSAETPFDEAPLYGGAAATSNFALTDESFRTLIYAKAYANISDGSIPSINNILMLVFGSQGACYVTDLGGMRMTYTFSFSLTAVDFAIVSQSGVLPKPTGVTATIVQL